MDRPTTRKEADARGSQLDSIEAFVLPSRRPALELCRDPRRSGSGPVLVTGDAGVGKTWLWRCIKSEASTSHRWLGVDLTPANEPADFYRLIAHELGLTEPGATGASRVDLVDFLADRYVDGERVALVIEEAHNLSNAVWEEVRVLANRLDRPDGFSSIILIGQTALARRLTTRPLASIEARLSAKIHLGPIDVDEAKEWLARLRPDRDWPIHEVEVLHRDSAGNPRRMLRRLGAVVGSIAPTPLEVASIRKITTTESPERAVIAEKPLPLPSPIPLTGPDRPPIQVEENMIEVGWSPEGASLPGEAEGDQARPAGTSPASEEAVKDHYAALQAWREWSENQERRAYPVSGPAEREPEPEIELDEDEEEERSSPLTDRPTVWADGEQRFAPFSQLFSRMAQAREPE